MELGAGKVDTARHRPSWVKFYPPQLGKWGGGGFNFVPGGAPRGPAPPHPPHTRLIPALYYY
jgi:hypothetical protein